MAEEATGFLNVDFDVRALESADLEAAGRVLVEAYPHRAHEPRTWQRSSSQEQPRRWGAFHFASGASRQSAVEMCGYAGLWRVEASRFRFDVAVTPRYVGHGLGRRLFEIVLLEAQRADAATLQARAYDTSLGALAFLARRRFVETMRMRGFVLRLTALDLPSLIAAADLTTSPDVSIDAVSSEQAADPAFWNELADLQNAAREGWPDPDPGGPITPCDPPSLRAMLMPREPPVAFFAASRRDRLLGYSLLVRRRDPGEAAFAATAVRPQERRRGIATALRARCLLVARASGYSTVRSASGSDGLIRINARFGFDETYCEVRLVRRLR